VPSTLTRSVSPKKENTIVSIEDEANQDLALSDDDAEGVTGGHAVRHKAKHKSAARTEPLYVDQAQTFGGTTVSASSGDDDCAPENGGGSD
jgi:hypothetical protein